MKLKNILLCTLVALVLAPTTMFAGARFSFSINMCPPCRPPICRPIPVIPVVPVIPYYYPYYPRPIMPCPPPPCPWFGITHYKIIR